jgi:SET domain
MKFRELLFMYGCDDDSTFRNGTSGTVAATARRRPIHNTSTWSYLRGVYNAVIKRNLCEDKNDPTRWNGTHVTSANSEDPNCFVEGIDAEPMNWTAAGGSGFFVPIVVQYSPGKGRGVFATAPIRKGQTVWVAWNEGWMRSGLLYRQLLEALPTNALRCDVMAFTYFTETDGGSGIGDISSSDGASNVENGDNEEYEWIYEEGGDEGDEEQEEEGVDEEEQDEDWEDEEEEDWEDEGDGDEEEEEEPGFRREDLTDIDVGPPGDAPDVEALAEDATVSEFVRGGDEVRLVVSEARHKVSSPINASGHGDTTSNSTDTADASRSETRARAIIVALDDAAVMNADWESDDGRKYVNVGPREEFRDAFDVEVPEGAEGFALYVAFRDIQAGEELICDYHNFALDDEGWARFGL